MESLQIKPTRVLIVSNKKVFGLYGEAVSVSASKAGAEVHLHLIGDGERFKNLRTLEQTLRTLSASGFTRSDAVIALGGGVVGDLAGFAASIHLRGIGFLQVPTTLLAMIDSSVGGKTSVNTSFGKNLVGSFYHPAGVLIDTAVLGTLAPREITAGLCEAIKHGAISGPKLLNLTANFIEKYRPNDFHRLANDPAFAATLRDLIAEHVRFKASIVQNDETESATNVTGRSRKILNFGHTFGHALEKVTDYKHLKHGEAVGYGIMFAAQLSKKLELIGHDEVNSLNDVVQWAGNLPAIAGIDQSKILEAFEHDKKRIGNSLQWVLLKGFGKPIIVPDSEIPRSAVKATLKTIFQK
jgi:3-dehydroquinate synthase